MVLHGTTRAVLQDITWPVLFALREYQRSQAGGKLRVGAAAEAGRGQHAVLCLWSLVQRGLLARRLAHRPLRQGAQLRLRRHRCTTAPTALQPPNGDSAEARANKEVAAGRAFDAGVVVRAGSGGVATLAFEFKPSGAADHLRDDIPHIGIPNFVEFGAAEEMEEQGPGEGGGRKVPANGSSAAASAADGDAGSEAEAGAMQLRQGGFQSGAAPKGPAFYFGVIKGQVGGQAVEKAVRCQVGTSHQGQTRPLLLFALGHAGGVRPPPAAAQQGLGAYKCCTRHAENLLERMQGHPPAPPPLRASLPHRRAVGCKHTCIACSVRMHSAFSTTTPPPPQTPWCRAGSSLTSQASRHWQSPARPPARCRAWPARAPPC